MDKSAQKALIDALSQHQAYLYRASSQSVNELTAQFNKLSNVQLLRLSELLENLTDSERKALQSVNFSSRAKASRNIEEIKATLSEWFSSLNTELPAIFEQSAIALAVYEAGYTVALMGETLKTDGEKLYQKAKKVPFSGGQLVDYLYARRWSTSFVMDFHKARPISRLSIESRAESRLTIKMDCSSQNAMSLSGKSGLRVVMYRIHRIYRPTKLLDLHILNSSVCLMGVVVLRVQT